MIPIFNIWTKNRIDRLKNSITNAETKIRDLFLNSVVNIDERYYGWGQFLTYEKKDNQYGIYGTSSAIQVLSFAGLSNENEYIYKACSLLCDFSYDENSRFNTKEDLYNLYKVAYLTDALNRCSSPKASELLHRLYQLLEESIIEGNGWGNFFDFKTNKKDSVPRITPTAIIMLSLIKKKDFINSDICRNILKWLSESVLAKQDIEIFEISLSAMVFNEYNIHIRFENADEINNECYKRLLKLSANRDSNSFLNTENHHYYVTIGNNRTNKYLFFLPDCLLALALLKSSKSNPNNKYILKIANLYSDKINQQNGFAPLNTRKFSTIDHLWIYVFFDQLLRTKTKKLIPNGISKYLSKPLYFYILLIVLLVGIAYFLYTASFNGFLRVLLGIIGITILPIGLNLIANWIDRKFLNSEK